jgi:hypothetical protein
VGLGWLVLGMVVRALMMVMVMPLLVGTGADAGVGVGMELVCLRLDEIFGVDGGFKGMHTGLPCVEGCALRMQRYEDVVTQLVAR